MSSLLCVFVVGHPSLRLLFNLVTRVIFISFSYLSLNPSVVTLPWPLFWPIPFPLFLPAYTPLTTLTASVYRKTQTTTLNQRNTCVSTCMRVFKRFTLSNPLIALQYNTYVLNNRQVCIVCVLIRRDKTLSFGDLVIFIIFLHILPVVCNVTLKSDKKITKKSLLLLF